MTDSLDPPVKKRLGRPPVIRNPRESILDAAAALFAERGYETSSLAELATAMQVSKAAIYHYFATKQEIYDAIIVRTMEGLTAAVAQAVAQESRADARLRAFMQAHGRYFEQEHAGFAAMLVGFAGMTNTDFMDEARRLRSDYEQSLRNILNQGIDEGSFRALDVATTSRAVLSMLNWMVRWFRPGKGNSAERVALDYYELLFQGIHPDR